MYDKHLRYQLVEKPDGILSIHEIVVDDEGNVTAFSYEPVKLEAESIGEIADILRQVYRDIRLYQPISEEELESKLYRVEEIDIPDEEEDSNVINLCDFFAGNA